MPKPTKILYIDNSFTFGGAINALADLIRELDRTRYSPVVLSAQDRTLLDKHFAGVPTFQWDIRLPWVHDRFHRRVIRLPGMRSGPFRSLWSKARAAWWMLFYEFPEAIRIARLARREGADMVHLNNGVESLVPGLLAAKLLRVPLVAHARGPQDTHGIARFWAAQPDHWIAVSDSVRDNLREAGVDVSRISTIHDAINLDVFEESRSPASLHSLGVPDGAPVFGVFGRIIPWKGIREFIVAARRVIEAVPDAYGLVVGDRSDGSEDYYREVEVLSQELGIGDRIIFTGFREDVPEMMKACNVVVHTSIVPEPFGLTVVEGMACGKPVVAANTGGPTEIVVDGETGVLVDPRDAAALSRAIVDLLRDPLKAEAMGHRGATRAREHFAAPRYARDVEEVYARVM